MNYILWRHICQSLLSKNMYKIPTASTVKRSGKRTTLAKKITQAMKQPIAKSAIIVANAFTSAIQFIGELYKVIMKCQDLSS